MQGDIVAITNASGNIVVEYSYDSWGKLISISGPGAGSLGTKNHFLYRGYYFDYELGLYYLNSRYYDPVTKRFINADDYVTTGVGMNGCNMFAYCNNSPITYLDENGEWPRWVDGLIGVVLLPVAPKTSAWFISSSIVKSVHYDKRKELNTDIPQTESEAKDRNWHGRLTEGEVSAKCHQFSGDNIKYVSPDGHKEVIFSSDGERVITDSRDIGTYNFCPSTKSKTGHFFVDVLPWILYGNDDDITFPIQRIISYTK